SMATAIATGVEHLHPLLHRNVSDLRGLRYLSRFSGDESVLAEHRVNGQAVLAGAAMIVMIQAALTDALGGAVPAGRGLVISDLSWRQPFSVDAANNGELFLELSMPAAGDYRIGIYAYDQAAQLQLHCQARASTAEVQAAWLDFSSLGAQVVDVEACYQRFAAMGIEYGAGHRRLLSLVRQGDQALARIALQDPALNSGFALHPALLDAAMQGVMALLLDELEERPALLLPAGLGQCVLLADCPASLQVQIRRAPSTAPDYCFDLALFDDQGQCCAILNQLSFQPLTGASLAAGPGANIGLLCHKHWHDARPAPTA
uniref:Polyketide synthase/nonribosomal peptide synthetase hybrid RzxB n=1 Tax=Pseudomonas fluorescens (strain ATCC BAA-477 / NRRL B-23932 / Pf-5) TaxID=220664 RepID=UPI0009B4EBB2|nr:Chain A, Polyketide synthase/nonribosomal peptide synthetase hybrid RzxB [Pseudomonas protegens Pf-5]5IL6_B Chain B, Polyketide synthase/nonribosomal peptide synthetase hybrid RzxB [Pseudomonas protegens Pf-5]